MAIFARTRQLAIGALALASAALAPAQPAPPPAGSASGVRNTLAQRLQPCTTCHGEGGRSTNVGYLPRIAGKPAGYLLHQLQNFQVGRRRNAAMSHLVEHMSGAYLQDIARYFAELDLPYPPARQLALDAGQVRVARELVFEGAPARGIPACVSCHGQQMAGKLPAMPGLLTLPADYLLGQLGAWRTGVRQAKAPDCMAVVAQRLTPEEIGAVARWLSAETLPTGTKPEPHTGPLPIPCGSDLE